LRFDILSDFRLLVHCISNDSEFPEIDVFEYVLAHGLYINYQLDALIIIYS